MPIYALRGVFCCPLYCEEVMQIYFTGKEHWAFERLMKGNLVITFATEILTAIGVT